MASFGYVPFLFLLFIGTVCNSMAVSFMGFYLVDGLDKAPWSISVYMGCFAFVVIIANRLLAAKMDEGANPFFMIGLAASSFFIAAVTISFSLGFLITVIFGAIGFGIGSSAMSTKFSIGGIVADRYAIKRSTFNAYMRATTSTSWMIGPALSFTIADLYSHAMVFQMAIVAGLVWLAVWWFAAPRDALTEPKAKNSDDVQGKSRNLELQIAVIFVFCLALAHSLTFSAIPIFFVQEVGLPGFAPGTAFTVKTFIELFAIFSTPFLINRFGLRMSLFGTALLAIVAILVIGTTTSLAHMYVGAALEGFYFGLFSTLAISFVQSLSTDRPAYGNALYWNTMMLTLIVAGPATGAIAQVFDFQTVIFIATLFAVLSAVILAANGFIRRMSTR